jgi:hypothetical protein
MDVNKLRQEAQKLTGKAETFLKDHHDQIESTVSKAETFAKSKTKNQKRDQQIDKVAGKLKGLIPSDDPNAPQAAEKAAKKPKPGDAAKTAKPAHPEPAGEHEPKSAEGEPGPSGLG